MGSLKGEAKRGIKISILEKGIVFALGLIQLGVIVRYIDKSEIGLMALVNTVLAFAHYYSELGIGNSLIYKQDTDRRQLSSIYWWQVLSGLLVYGLVALLAKPIAGFFVMPNLEWMLYVLGATIFINSFGQCYASLLYRDLHFGFLSLLRTIVALLGFLTIAVLAINGYGLWALIVGALVKSLAQTIILHLYGRSFFWPDLHLKLREIRPHIQFGLYQTGERLANLFNQQFDNLIIGKLLGEEILGVYDVIKQLLGKAFQMVNSLITTVMLPILAKFQGDTKKISDIYLKQLLYLSSCNFPIYIFLSLNTAALFSYLLNPEWLIPSNQLLVIYFCLYFIAYSVQNPLGILLISHGRVKQSFWYNLVLGLLIIPVVFWGAHVDILMVIKLLVISQYIRIFTSYYFLLKPLVNFSLLTFFATLMPPLGISLASIFASHYLVGLGNMPPMVALILEGGLAVAFYTGLSFLWNRPFWEEAVGFFKKGKATIKSVDTIG